MGGFSEEVYCGGWLTALGDDDQLVEWHVIIITIKHKVVIIKMEPFVRSRSVRSSSGGSPVKSMRETRFSMMDYGFISPDKRDLV